jgi:hypothetical protein
MPKLPQVKKKCQEDAATLEEAMKLINEAYLKIKSVKCNYRYDNLGITDTLETTKTLALLTREKTVNALDRVEGMVMFLD